MLLEFKLAYYDLAGSVAWGCRINGLQRDKTPSRSLLDMTLNNLMVKFQ